MSNPCILCLFHPRRLANGRDPQLRGGRGAGKAVLHKAAGLVAQLPPSCGPHLSEPHKFPLSPLHAGFALAADWLLCRPIGLCQRPPRPRPSTFTA